MYNPARHGSYALSDIGVIQNMDPYDFGCVQAGYRTYWIVARTSSGETVFLRDTPLFRDVPLYHGDSFDDGFTTNDNFGNSWLSEDGKTLFLARGQTVRRFAPYDVPYDLLPNSSRIMTIYSTVDGVDWRYRHSISSCGPLDTPFSQQYGADIKFMPDAGLHLAFVNAYDSESQQIYLDLKYSRDGIHFYDFTDPHPFAKTANPFDWYFGELFTSQDIVQVGDRYYQLASGTSLPHYFAEPLFRHDAQSEITADDFKSLFANRRFAESLPYFKSIGGWEGLAEHTRNGHYSVGVMSYRADGWFGVRAGHRKGGFVTRPSREAARSPSTPVSPKAACSASSCWTRRAMRSTRPRSMAITSRPLSSKCPKAISASASRCAAPTSTRCTSNRNSSLNANDGVRQCERRGGEPFLDCQGS
jgi:hypothetical protein